MISFICCSIDPRLAEQLKRNIEQTIGSVEFEFIAFDNREHNYGLCKVYNMCAREAKYENLCFLHEDIVFNSVGWGERIEAKLSEPDCGVIGFAGSVIRLNGYGRGWLHGSYTARQHFVQHYKGAQAPKSYLRFGYRGGDFEQVAVLDGMMLFVRRDVWSEMLFDEELLTRFHGYDIDFCLSVATRYRNYVCYTMDIEHLSGGSYTTDWGSQMALVDAKWAIRDGGDVVVGDDDDVGIKCEILRCRLKSRGGADCQAVGFGDIFALIARYPHRFCTWAILFRNLKYRLRRWRRSRVSRCK